MNQPAGAGDAHPNFDQFEVAADDASACSEERSITNRADRTFLKWRRDFGVAPALSSAGALLDAVSWRCHPAALYGASRSEAVAALATATLERASCGTGVRHSNQSATDRIR
jgi:hypothetical protein